MAKCSNFEVLDLLPKNHQSTTADWRRRVVVLICVFQRRKWGFQRRKLNAENKQCDQTN